MSHDNRKWVIITLSSYNDEQLENLCANAIQTSKDTLRKNLAGDKAILKWDENTPEVFDGMETLNHSEIRTELAKNTWTNEDD